MKRLSLLIVAIFLSACGGSSSSIDGTYSGPINDAVAGAGTARVTMASNGNSLSGTWSSTFSNASYNNSGSTSGTISGSSLSMTLAPSNPQACPLAVTATQSGNQITGTYATMSCSVTDSGSFNLTKQ